MRTRSHVRIRAEESLLERKRIVLVLVRGTPDEPFVQVEASILCYGRTCKDS